MKELGAAFVLFALTSCEWNNYYTPPAVDSRIARNSEVRTLERGRILYSQRCLECHALPPVWHYRKEDWPGIVDSMARRADLKPNERDTILAYINAARANK
jgi:hypothetical protein